MSAIVVAGDTSGSVTLQAPAVSGTTVITLPATSGTMALSGGAGSFTTVEASSTIKGGSTIGVGGATPSASGAGITFPATQSASTDANTLDDYEEGTWTPAKGLGVTLVGTYSSVGRYTKIGDTVYVDGVMSGTTSLSTGGQSQITNNLPFVSSTIYSGFGGLANSTSTTSTFIATYQSQFFAQGTAIGATPTLSFSCVYKIA